MRAQSKVLIVGILLMGINIVAESTGHSNTDHDVAKGARMVAAGITTLISGVFASQEGEVTFVKEISKIGVFLGIFAIFDIYRGHSLVGLVKDMTLIALAYKALNNEPVDEAIKRLGKKRRLIRAFVTADKKKNPYDTQRLIRLFIGYRALQEMGLMSRSA